MTALAALRARMPDRVKEAARLALARRLERHTRAGRAIRGAAFVLHAVAPFPGDHEREVDPAIGVRQLDLLVGYLARRYRLVRAGDLLDAARSRAPGEPVPVALTFDDDLASHLEQAAPVLSRHGAVATAFLCGSREPFWWHALQAAVDASRIRPPDLPELPGDLVADALERRPRAIGRLAKAIEDLEPERRDAVAVRLREAVPALDGPLDLAQASALAARGWELGFHTRRHDMLMALDDHRLAEALTDGRDLLPGGPARTLAYPHGKAGAREARAAREAGYTAAFTGAAEIVTDATDPHLIGRLQPDLGSTGRFAFQFARALADV